MLAAVLHWFAGDDGDRKEDLPPVNSSRLIALRHDLNFSTGERAEHDDEHYVDRVDEIFSLYVYVRARRKIIFFSCFDENIYNSKITSTKV